MEKFHFLSFSRRSQASLGVSFFSSSPLSSGFGMKTNSEAAAATIRLPSSTAEENNISMEKPLPEMNKKNKSRQLASIFLFISVAEALRGLGGFHLISSGKICFSYLLSVL
jgi:hypothetical protein